MPSAEPRHLGSGGTPPSLSVRINNLSSFDGTSSLAAGMACAKVSCYAWQATSAGRRCAVVSSIGPLRAYLPPLPACLLRASSYLPPPRPLSVHTLWRWVNDRGGRRTPASGRSVGRASGPARGGASTEAAASAPGLAQRATRRAAVRGERAWQADQGRAAGRRGWARQGGGRAGRRAAACVPLPRLSVRQARHDGCRPGDLTQGP
jgi:hypothetical protein